MHKGKIIIFITKFPLPSVMFLWMMICLWKGLRQCQLNICVHYSTMFNTSHQCFVLDSVKDPACNVSYLCFFQQTTPLLFNIPTCFHDMSKEIFINVFNIHVNIKANCWIIVHLEVKNKWTPFVLYIGPMFIRKNR